MLSLLRAKYAAFIASFHDSEIIWWARIQVLGGLILAALVSTDLSAFFSDPKALAVYVFLNGALTEYLRRRRATEDDNGNMQ